MLKQIIEPFILESKEIRAYSAPPVTQFVIHTNEPLVLNGIVENGRIVGSKSWCALGFESAWQEQKI
ncbi:MAG: hypothetical protein GXZ11_09280 [Tissierellia bacterium]|nr:hypothetical protein [Tissierellia bacterium]